MIGRSWAVAARCQAGAEHIHEAIRVDTVVAIAITGVTDVADIGSSILSG